MKYRSVKTYYNGRSYDSKKEAQRACQLEIMLKGGLIQDLEYQVIFRIEHNGVKICKYIADFVYTENGKRIVEDCKSPITRKLPVYRLKKKLLLAFFDIDILET